MNESKALQVFSFEENEIRTTVIDGKIWFVAADVCKALGIGNVSLAVNGRPDREDDGLDEDEKGIANVNTLSGNQQMLCVNESGLQELIWKSRKPKAKSFKRWIKREVIPAIASTGVYDPQGQIQALQAQILQLRLQPQQPILQITEKASSKQAIDALQTIETQVKEHEIGTELPAHRRSNLEYCLQKAQGLLVGRTMQRTHGDVDEYGNLRLHEYPKDIDD